jgi:hypothetical protein
MEGAIEMTTTPISKQEALKALAEILAEAAVVQILAEEQAQRERAPQAREASQSQSSPST